MSEFGHTGTIATGLCIDMWGAGPFTLEVDGKTFHFEDSDRFGPLFLGKSGNTLKNQFMAERSPFWRAHRIWVRQGRRLEDGKVCIWDEPKPTKFRKIRRKTSIIVEQGEEDGRYIQVE
jgi:hypothetical protein